MTTFMTLEQLWKIGKIKNYGKLSKKELVKELGFDENIVCRPSNAKPVWIENIDNEEITLCESIYRCAKVLNKRLSSVQYFIRTGRQFKDDNGHSIILSLAA